MSTVDKKFVTSILIIVLAILIFTLLFIYLKAAKEFRLVDNFEKHGLSEQGIILQRESRDSSCSTKDTSFVLKYRYSVREQTFIDENIIYDCDLYEQFTVGTTIEILYLENNPSESHVAKDKFLDSDFLFLAYCASCLFAPVIILLMVIITKI